MHTLADQLQRHKVALILFFAVLTVVGGYYACHIRFEVQSETLLRSDDPGQASPLRFEEVFPSSDSRFLVALDLNPAFDQGGEALLLQVADAFRAIPGITRVVTPRDAVGGRNPAASKSLRDLLLAHDMGTGALVVFLDDEINTPAGRKRVFTAVHGELDRHLPRECYAIVGSPFYRHEFERFLVQDQLIFIPVTLGLVLAILALIFRRPLWVVLPLLAVVMTVIWTGGLMGVLNRPMTMLTGALPTLLIAIGVTVAIHVIFRFREEAHRGGSPDDVARRTVANVGLPCLLSTVTTMAGFGSLVLARVPDIREFGILAAVGVGFSFLICIVLLPYALAADLRRHPERTPGSDPAEQLGGMLARCSELATRRPRAVTLASVLLIAVATWGVAHVDMDAYLTDDMGDTTFIFHSYRFFDERLASMIPLDVVVESSTPGGLFTEQGQQAMAAVQAFCDRQPFVAKTLSALDALEDLKTYRPLTMRFLRYAAGLFDLGEAAPLGSVFRRLNEEAPVGALTDESGRIGRIVLLLKDVGARRSLAFYEDLAAFARRELPAGYQVSPAGTSVLANQILISIITEGVRSFFVAFTAIFLVVSLLFRSVRTGLLCLVGTTVPVYAGLGAMGALGIVIRTATVIVGSITLGLAIDLTIHLLGRYRRERAAGLGCDEARHRAMVHTGKPIVVSGGILVLGFGTLGFSRFGLTSEFGIVAAITIFTALVTTLFMLPSLLRLGVLRNGAGPRRPTTSRETVPEPLGPGSRRRPSPGSPTSV